MLLPAADSTPRKDQSVERTFALLLEQLIIGLPERAVHCELVFGLEVHPHQRLEFFGWIKAGSLIKAGPFLVDQLHIHGPDEVTGGATFRVFQELADDLKWLLTIYKASFRLLRIPPNVEVLDSVKRRQIEVGRTDIVVVIATGKPHIDPPDIQGAHTAPQGQSETTEHKQTNSFQHSHIHLNLNHEAAYQKASRV